MTQFNPTPAPVESGNKFNVSSYGPAFFNDEQTMLQVTFLNDSLSIAIRKGVVDPVTGKTKYPKDPNSSMGNTTLLTSEMVATFYESLVNDFLPWYLDGKSATKAHSVGLFTTRMRNKLVDVYAGPDTKYPQLRIFANINEDRVPGEVYTYTFRPTTSINDYQPGGSDFTLEEVHGQFMMFLKCLSTFMEAITKAHHHAEAVGGNYDRTRVYEYLSKIGAHLGLGDTLVRNQYQQNNTFGGNNGFTVASNNSMMQPDTTTPPITQMGSLDDMLPC